MKKMVMVLLVVLSMMSAYSEFNDGVLGAKWGSSHEDVVVALSAKGFGPTIFLSNEFEKDLPLKVRYFTNRGYSFGPLPVSYIAVKYVNDKFAGIDFMITNNKEMENLELKLNTSNNALWELTKEDLFLFDGSKLTKKNNSKCYDIVIKDQPYNSSHPSIRYIRGREFLTALAKKCFNIKETFDYERIYYKGLSTSDMMQESLKVDKTLFPYKISWIADSVESGSEGSKVYSYPNIYSVSISHYQLENEFHQEYIKYQEGVVNKTLESLK